MTSIAPTERQMADAQFSQTRCVSCGFPAGKLVNNLTGGEVARFFYKCQEGYGCNQCVEDKRVTRIAKLTKSMRRQYKKMKRSILGMKK